MKNNLIPSIQKIGNYSFDSNKTFPVSSLYQQQSKSKDKILLTDDYKQVIRNSDGSYRYYDPNDKTSKVESNSKSNIQKVGDITFDSDKLQEMPKSYMETYLPHYKGKDKILSSTELMEKFKYRRDKGVYEGMVVRNEDGSYKKFNIIDYLPDAPVTPKSKQETPQWMKDRDTKKTDDVKFYETLNYKNWGLKDYSDYTTRGSAFRNARTNGEKEFIYKGVRYPTTYAGTPEQQLRETGLTNEQIQDRSSLNKNLGKNISPVGKYDIGEALGAFFTNKTSSNRIFVDNVLNDKMTNKDKKRLELSSDIVDFKHMQQLSKQSMDAYNLYLGIPQKYKTLEVSDQIPSKSTEKNKTYYKFNDEAKSRVSNQLLKWVNSSSNKKDILSDAQNVMGRYTASKGKDERGEYISYYDKWDLDFLGTVSPQDFGKPYEMYDRIYVKKQGDKYVKMNYTDDELSKLNPNSKNFDVKSLQEELSNRGYDMWSSRNKTGLNAFYDNKTEFDGIYGNDTKSALEAYQKGIPAFEYNAFKYEKGNKKMYGGKLLPSINKL